MQIACTYRRGGCRVDVLPLRSARVVDQRGRPSPSSANDGGRQRHPPPPRRHLQSREHLRRAEGQLLESPAKVTSLLGDERPVDQLVPRRVLQGAPLGRVRPPEGGENLCCLDIKKFFIFPEQETVLNGKTELRLGGGNKATHFVIFCGPFS